MISSYHLPITSFAVRRRRTLPIVAADTELVSRAPGVPDWPQSSCLVVVEDDVVVDVEADQDPTHEPWHVLALSPFRRQDSLEQDVRDDVEGSDEDSQTQLQRFCFLLRGGSRNQPFLPTWPLPSTEHTD